MTDKKGNGILKKEQFLWDFLFNSLFVCCCGRVMLVGWGGNNGSTLTGGVIANRE